jgi:hypothetical protein
MDCRTASSNSIGPGINSAGCSGWLDILTGGAGGGSDLFSCVCVWGMGLGLGGVGLALRFTFPVSSSSEAERSVEKGVFSWRKGLGLGSRWRERRLRRDLGDAPMTKRDEG